MARVLILNSDETIAAELARTLAGGGHQVRGCEKPFQALRRVRLATFDLLWMSWPLAGMDAVHFLRRIWVLQPELPVVAIGKEEEVDTALRRQLKACGVKMILQRAPKAPLALAITSVCARQLPPAPPVSV